MSSTRPTPIDEEIRFLPEEIIVSKTDLKGRIQYANDVFCRVAEMQVADIIGQPHSIIRHPDMPRAVFKLLWDTVQSGKEIFTYVKNMSSTGKYYWVIAHITPTFDANKAITGFHSNRRLPSTKGVQDVIPLYRELVSIEKSFRNAKEGLAASVAHLEKMLAKQGVDYDEFIWSTGE